MKQTGLVLGVLAFAAIGLVAQQKPAAGGGDEAAIAKLRAAYQTAAAAQDAAGIAKLYATDGEEMPPNAPSAKGRAAIEKYHKDFATQFMVHGITITSSAVHLAGNWAIDVGTYKQQLMSQKNGSVADDHGKYIVVMKKDGANWAIANLIYNSDVPPPPAPAKK
jgi:uncharacterized protein (TIGR02246 family)